MDNKSAVPGIIAIRLGLCSTLTLSHLSSKAVEKRGSGGKVPSVL